MTVTTHETGTISDPGPPNACGLCGSPMHADQEWCLECGAARTVIARAPDWRVPVLVIGAVVLIVAGGLALALSALSNNAGKLNVIGADTSTGTTTSPIASWPPGLDGYTVLLNYKSTQSQANGLAAAEIAANIKGVGVLSTAQHPIMKPANVFYVFVGRDSTLQQAQGEATALQKAGQPEAKAALVQKPGGS